MTISLFVCACGCGRQAPPDSALCDSGGAWWRFGCAARALKGVRCLQNLPPAELGTLVSLLRANSFGLADTIVGSVPFDEGA
jgi:hypothetical protein